MGRAVFDKWGRGRDAVVYAPQLEALEPRVLLSGTTLLFHGAALSSTDDPGLPTWVAAMSSAIATRVATLHGTTTAEVAQYKLDIDDDGAGPVGSWTFAGNYAPGVSALDAASLAAAGTGEAIIAVDWTDLADPLQADGRATGTVAGYVVAALTVGLGELGEQLLSGPLHLMGHSRGASVVGAMAAQLAEMGLWVDQVTLLDPHPVSGDYGYAAGDVPLTENVVYADNYYRQGLGLSGWWVDGAKNHQLSDDVLANGGYGGLFGAHSDVHLWYHGTADTDGVISNGDVNGFDPSAAGWYGGVHPERTTSAYNVSRSSGEGDARFSAAFSGGLAGDWGGTAPRTNVSVDVGSAWPNVAIVGVASSRSLMAGTPIELEGRVGYEGTGQVTLTVGLDTNANPYDGGVVLEKGAPATSGLMSLETTGLAGRFYAFVKVSDGSHVRYFYDSHATTIIESPTLAGDFDGDGQVDQGDLTLLLSNWGATVAPGPWPADFDGTVDQNELTELLSNWGAGVAVGGEVLASAELVEEASDADGAKAGHGAASASSAGARAGVVERGLGRQKGDSSEIWWRRSGGVAIGVESAKMFGSTY